MPTSLPPEPVLRGASVGVRITPAALALAGTLTVVFVAGHVPFLPGTRDGIDSANFVLAVDRYDPRSHQPHPPGFPVHVALGRLVNSVYQVFAPAGGDDEFGTAAASLRVWSVLTGALAVFPLVWVATGLGASVSRAALVAALAATCPLFWVTAMRPLSDAPGLFFTMAAQALTLEAHKRNVGRQAQAPDRREHASSTGLDLRLLAAAAIAGIAVGVRLQTALLTVPLLALVVVLRAKQGRPAVIASVLIAFLVGLLAWAIPMVGALGGPGEYLRLLTTVATDDVRSVEMLATHPSPRVLAQALLRTFIAPWGLAPLGWCAFALTVVGAIALVRRNWRAFAFATVMGLPYLVFHLLFQETVSIRYALPLVPLSCFFIAASFQGRTAALAVPLAAVMLAWASAVSVNAATAYGRNESPVARALEDLRRETATRSQRSPLAFHHAVGRAIRGEAWLAPVLDAPVRYEWLELARYWLEGGRAALSFLADGRRTDLALIDPVSRRLVRAYRWPDSTEPLLGGIQPLAVNWYEMAPPGWFLMRGWAVTPETHGVARRDGQSPGTTGIVGHIRRRDVGAVMMIGGRNLGGPCDTGAVVEVSIDGRTRASWSASSQSSFLQVIALAPGELRGSGEYATLSVTARDAADTARVVDVAIEHFDVQSAGASLHGFDRGWHMPELDPATGLSWRWTDGVAELRAETFGRDVDLVMRGESPLVYFQTPPRVVVRAGELELASFRPDADFEWVVPLPAAALAASDGRVTIESDRWFVPDEVSGDGDRRRLALRVYHVETRPRPTSTEPAVVR